MRPSFRLRVTGLLTAIAALALAACDDTKSAPGVITLHYASGYPPNHPFSRADTTWIDYIQKKSNGRLKVVSYWSGSLISSAESIEELRHDVADIATITPIYIRGGAHALRTQTGFYAGVRDIAEQVAVYKCLAATFPEFGYELRGIHVLAVQGGNFPGILTRDRPIVHLADFRGQRVRGQTEALPVLHQLGADPIDMPMNEVYSAMAKGVIDGVTTPADAVLSLHFAEIGLHFTALHFPRGAYPARAMSDRAWQRLPPDLQALLLESSSIWETSLNTEILEAETRALKYMASRHMEIHRLLPDEQKEFDQLFLASAREQALDLRHFGIDGEPMFDAAQNLIHQEVADGHLDCHSEGDHQP